MELSTTTRGKAKLLWNGYTKHTEKNYIIRWHCTCHASKLCPASAYTDLLPAYPVLKIDHNHCPEPMKLEVIFFKEICLYRIFIGFTKMPCYQNVGYQDVLLPKCLLPKCPVTKMSCYRNVSYQNVHYQSVLYRNVWIPWIGYSFEYAPLVLKCCYCNVFDHVYLKFVNASYLYLIQKP